jgi:dUTP pyrophosphatase
MKLRIKKTNPRAILPTRAKPGDSGLDLYACLPTQGYIILLPGDRQRLWTGIAIELPVGSVDDQMAGRGWEAQVRSRSGLTNLGIVACGGLGTVDNGYRGEIGVTLFNHSGREYRINHGDRIAQLVVAPVVYPEVIEVDELSETERGAGGFGSTGV